MNQTNTYTNLDRWRKAGFLATVVIFLSLPLYLIKHTITKGKNTTQLAEAQYVGGDKCIDCHLKEYSDWQGSDHDNAMDVATPESVKGDFNDVIFRSANGTESSFYKRDGKYFVKTPGPGGEIAEFQITHTFGIRPLQQYLVPFDSGRLQCLPIAWDTERKRWFSLPDSIYKDENLTSDNWLYWTNNGQNWNGMCADCHTTNLKKGYNVHTHIFTTSWSDIDVNCEACHGPGSKHILWANLPVMNRPEGDMGLVVQTGNITPQELVNQCARCHARRSVQDDFDPEMYHQDVMNYMIPQLPVPSVYFADGQILDEDYVYASFTQSYMYHQDVSCKDCHNVHSLEFVLPPENNALCLQCHRADEYDTYNHYFHKKAGESGSPLRLKTPWQGKNTIAVGEGSLCINCHMPGRYYMGVDFRRDHSFRVPRPDLTIKYGTPNACNDCHTDQTPQWADRYIKEWYGPRRKYHYSETFLKAVNRDTTAIPQLIHLSVDPLYPFTVRATSVYHLGSDTAEKSIQTIVQALSDPESLIRLTAIDALPVENPEQFVATLAPLLKDPVRTVRSRAAFRLSPFHEQIRSMHFTDDFEKAINDYRLSMEYMGDFASSRHNLGVMYGNMGDYASAIQNYREALRIDNLFYPSMLNLALIYNRQGKNDAAEKLLRRVLSLHPEVGETYYYLGLLLAENKDDRGALEFLMQASQKMPENTRILYNIALLYQQMHNPQKAEDYFIKCLKKDPANYDYLYATGVFYLNRGRIAEAEKTAEKMNQLFPGNQNVQNLLRAISKTKSTVK